MHFENQKGEQKLKNNTQQAEPFVLSGCASGACNVGSGLRDRLHNGGGRVVFCLLMFCALQPDLEVIWDFPAEG